MTNVQINPKWLAWNNGVNEGGEGYNPHTKWIAKAAAPVAAIVRSAADNRMLRDQRGNLTPAAKLQAQLDKDTARMAVITNESAREITQAAIDHARQQLGI